MSDKKLIDEWLEVRRIKDYSDGSDEFKNLCVVKEVNELKGVIKNLLGMLVAVNGIDDYARSETEKVLIGIEKLDVFVEVKK